MHRNRVWATTSPIFRTERNRVLVTDGNLPTLDPLNFNPTNQIIDAMLLGISALTPSFVLSNVSVPNLQLKYSVDRMPTGATFYFKRNNGSFLTLNPNTLNGAALNTGDTITFGISANGAPDASFTFTVFNNIDVAPCSNTLSALITGASLPPEPD
jgi:hypothetical protein